jgi:flagellar hook-associated protein 1
MDSMSIAIGALNAAKLGLDVAGNNISNAATEGYHRQRLELTPAYSSSKAGFMLGGGVNVADITRLIDNVLEKQITLQSSLSSQADTELNTLNSVEAAFGELSGDGGLSSTIDNFFSSFESLSSNPSSPSLQTQVLSTAEAMATQFRSLGTFLSGTNTSILEKAQTTVKQVNELAVQIAELNSQIQDSSLKGAATNNLMDQRDARINDLSKLVGISTVERGDGVVDVTVGASWLVVDENVQKIQVSVQADGKLGIAPEGSMNYTTELEGGQLGAYFSLNNTSVASIKDRLDTLAAAVIDSVNRYQVQGIGSGGSFTEMLGSSMYSENLSEWDPPVSDGDVFIRVVDTATGEVTRTAVHVDASADTLSTMAAKFNAVSGITAQVESGRLSILASDGYKFDFAPAMANPPSDTTTETLVPESMSGVYTGSTNETWTFTVVGSGTVGDSSNLIVRVTDADGNPVAPDLNVGTGYVAGQPISLGNGISITLGRGELAGGDSFSIDAIANSDTSGFLAAAGMNTFFSGRSTRDMALSDSITDSPSRVAASLGSGSSDGLNIARFTGLRDTATAELGAASITDYYQQLVTDIGRDVSLKGLRVKNIDAVTQNLKAQREQRSGVDLNDEAAQMLVFEQMFQASARYLTTVQSTMNEIMKLL